MRFVNRQSELAHLEKESKDKGAKFVVIYGRRRVGKTRLIEEFLKDKKGIYYLAAQEKDRLQIQEFKNVIYDQIKDEFLLNATFEDWKQLFLYLEKVLPKKERIILAIDEATFLIKENPSFTSYLQKFWDPFLSKTNIFLILSGSLVGLMLNSVLSYDSPLYGRRTSQINLGELSFNEAINFMPNKELKEQIKFFSVTGGIPKYLELIKARETFDEFLSNNFFNKEGFFYKEGLFLLSQEFKEPSTYLNILKGISCGNTKLNEIANFTGLETKKISAYLDILMSLNLVTKDVPITEDEKRFRGAIYLINDNFLTFWHRFVHPNRSPIELRRTEGLVGKLKNEINAYIGSKFEEICKEFLVKSNISIFDKIGRWWYKDNEIDIVALNKKEKGILFGECKWQDNVDSDKILNELKEKSGLVDWNNKEREDYFAIFAKSFKKRIKQKNLFLFDLKDIGRLIKR